MTEAELEERVEFDCLIRNLRALARYEHSDHSIGHEAADTIILLCERLRFARQETRAAIRAMREADNG